MAYPGDYPGSSTFPGADAPVDVVPCSMSLHGGGSLDTTALVTITPARMSLHGGGRLNLRRPLDWADDPRHGRPQWKFVLADMPVAGGELLAELRGIAHDLLEEDVETLTSGAFTIATRHPKRSLIRPVTTWLHVYRGRHHMGGGPILPNPSTDGAVTTYTWRDPRWYFSGDFRPIKQIPRRDLIKNGDFKQGLRYWRGGYDTGTIPALPPLVSVVASDYEPGGRALRIRGADKSQLTVEDVKTGAVFVPNSSTYLSGGAAIIQAVGTHIPNGSTVHIVGHTANNSINGDFGDGMALSLARANAAKATLLAQNGTLTITTEGKGYYYPVASNSTEAGQALNRRVVISYEGTQSALGSAQYESQPLTVNQPKSAKVPLRLSLVGALKISDAEWIGPNLPKLAASITVRKVGAPAKDEPYSEATVAMDDDTPRDEWWSTSQLEGRLEVEVPNDGLDYIVSWKLYAPAGVIDWTDVHLYPDDGLRFFDTDEALIVKGIVEHAQDPAKGWADLGIATRTPLTGVKRRRKEYPYYLQRPTDVALAEFPAMDRGLEISCEVAPDGATLVTHYPRRGAVSPLVLRMPGNVTSWEPATTRDVASLVIAQADGSGIARPEKYAIDTTALGGLLLGRIVNAEDETPINELDELAVRDLRRSKRSTAAYWVTVPPRAATAVLQLGMGDTLRLSLPGEYDGRVRVVKRQPDPNTDAVRLMLAVED